MVTGLENVLFVVQMQHSNGVTRVGTKGKAGFQLASNGRWSVVEQYQSRFIKVD